MAKYLTLLLIFITAASVYPQGFLKTSGKKIINSNGQEVYLQGIGLGGWLVPEGYMLQTSGFANSPAEIKNKIESIIGPANTDLFFQQYYKNYVSRKDIDKIAEWGFNSVRLPLHYKLLMSADQPGVYNEDGFKMIDSALAWCEQNHIYLILDLHCAPGAQNKDNISDSDGQARLWSEASKYQPLTISLWKKLAGRYAGKEWIGGYDLLNETVYDFPTGNQELRNFFIKVTDSIRQVDKNHIIFIEGNRYATDFSGLTPPWDNNMAYSFHKYWNETTTGTIQYLLDIRNSYNVPLWLGETGENSNQWFTETVRLMKQNNIGWAWWPHKKLGTISAPLSSPVDPGYQKLLNYWKSGTSKPTADEAFAALMNMAGNLAIDKCEFHGDVVDALFRQPESFETLPYAQNIIPGRISAVNYDIGQRGYAYQDNTYRTIGSGEYNSGWGLRNDGVDIEKCLDPAGGGYNVGWIEDGEWLKYTVNIESEGKYEMKLRIACKNPGGSIQAGIDGVILPGTAAVPVTGDWQSWQTINGGTFTLPQGKHSLQIRFNSGGFNFNYAEFTKVTSGVKDSKAGALSYELKQNYPNPFNPETVIPFSIAVDGNVSLKIHDILGNEAAVIINEYRKSGSYTAVFNGSMLPGGVYFCTLESGNVRMTRKLILLK
ncbi:MAG: cellulase family glycosylhydrolase [Syntrophomonadaceae bacterium]